MIRACYRIACVSLITLILLCIAWEWRLAPVQQGGSWLVLKCLPLLVALRGILRARRYTFQWATMLIVFYFGEGIVRAMTDKAPAQWLAFGEVLLSLTFFMAAVGYLRLTRASRLPPAA